MPAARATGQAFLGAFRAGLTTRVSKLRNEKAGCRSSSDTEGTVLPVRADLEAHPGGHEPDELPYGSGGGHRPGQASELAAQAEVAVNELIERPVETRRVPAAKHEIQIVAVGPVALVTELGSDALVEWRSG